jgi:hypothetical protein
MGRISNFCMSAACLLILAGCSTLKPVPEPTRQPKAKPGLHLPDKVQFLQTDKRWARETLGGSNESLESEGCLITAAAMALVNLGFQTDPGDLSRNLKDYGGFNSRGWLVWSGLERATAGKAKTVFYDRKDDKGHANAVRACLSAGYYPLVKFDLPSGKNHWVMVVKDTKQGFYVRDPMVNSRQPIPLSMRTKTIDAVRCIGVKT